MTDKKEKTEKELRLENAVAGEGAHVNELNLEEGERNKEVAGNIKETRISGKQKEAEEERDKEAASREEGTINPEKAAASKTKEEEAKKAAAKNQTSTTTTK